MDRKQKALEVIATISGREAGQLAPEMDLVGDLGIDSPKALELLVELEDALGIEISDEDAGNLSTVGEILTYLQPAH